MFIPYFVYIAHFTKFTRGIYLLIWKNRKRKKVRGKKREKKKETGPKKKESTILSRREKISLWKRLVLAELLAGEQRIKNKEVAVKPKFAMHDVKNEVFFCLQVPALVQNINQWQEDDK